VLFDASAQVHLIDFTVLGAMYGETQISIPLRTAANPQVSLRSSSNERAVI
jgi:hypothetical protein